LNDRPGNISSRQRAAQFGTAGAARPRKCLFVSDQCPQCSGPLVSEQSTVAWCAVCDWNLDAYEAEKPRRLARWQHRTAYRLNREMFDFISCTAQRMLRRIRSSRPLGLRIQNVVDALSNTPRARLAGAAMCNHPVFSTNAHNPCR